MIYPPVSEASREVAKVTEKKSAFFCIFNTKISTQICTIPRGVFHLYLI